ncbi:MAG TPA: permease [Elusimicrobiales bacterium]|nr:permease [Elusimicrobiales bacterium]HOL63042.1 permease [Elusimicrobiales bacterium]HPO95349.1 permease [Elusimicrobiales bacterium]
MNWKDELKPFFYIFGAFLTIYFLPVGYQRFNNAIFEGLYLVKWYAREHFLLCLIPALFIAGAIAVFVSQDSVLKYFGSGANKILSYSVASVSGTVLAVCSCTILPLFAGIYKKGAGIGPATTFLYSGPAINVLAIVLTARVLGFEMGAARAVFSIIFGIIIGLIMSFIFKDKKEDEKKDNTAVYYNTRPLYQTAVYFASLVGILVFTNWGRPIEEDGLWYFVFLNKWKITLFFFLLMCYSLYKWLKASAVEIFFIIFVPLLFWFTFGSYEVAMTAGILVLSVVLLKEKDNELGSWLEQTWSLAKMIIPLLFYGVFAAGFFLGRPGYEGIIPSDWVKFAVGGNSIFANFFASIVGAFMYFATLTEVPILQGLMGSGMGKGPALALLLSGPALSLQSMLILNKIMGSRKTVVYVSLVVIMSSVVGWFYGMFF